LAIDHHDLTHCIAVKLVKKLFGEKDVEDVLHRLDRLTLDEARNTGAQTLEVVYGLAANMRLILDGGATLSELPFTIERPFPLGGEATADGIRNALGKSSTGIGKRISPQYVWLYDRNHARCRKQNQQIAT